MDVQSIQLIIVGAFIMGYSSHCMTVHVSPTHATPIPSDLWTNIHHSHWWVRNLTRTCPSQIKTEAHISPATNFSPHYDSGAVITFCASDHILARTGIQIPPPQLLCRCREVCLATAGMWRGFSEDSSLGPSEVITTWENLNKQTTNKSREEERANEKRNVVLVLIWFNLGSPRRWVHLSTLCSYHCCWSLIDSFHFSVCLSVCLHWL